MPKIDDSVKGPVLDSPDCREVGRRKLAGAEGRGGKLEGEEVVLVSAVSIGISSVEKLVAWGDMVLQ